FTDSSRRSFGERFNELGEKWVLSSGTVVENVIFFTDNNDQETYRLGLSIVRLDYIYDTKTLTNCKWYSPLHSFMLDLSDPNVENLFSHDYWQEIIADLPDQEMYSLDVAEYMDKFTTIKSISKLEEALKDRTSEPVKEVIYNCLYQWLASTTSIFFFFSYDVLNVLLILNLGVKATSLQDVRSFSLFHNRRPWRELVAPERLGRN
ncbi:hypothetical protein BGZ76_007361, partial [Entomortierella beljakovae]